jgi:hypothetical protein
VLAEDHFRQKLSHLNDQVGQAAPFAFGPMRLINPRAVHQCSQTRVEQPRLPSSWVCCLQITPLSHPCCAGTTPRLLACNTTTTIVTNWLLL